MSQHPHQDHSHQVWWSYSCGLLKQVKLLGLWMGRPREWLEMERCHNYSLLNNCMSYIPQQQTDKTMWKVLVTFPNSTIMNSFIIRIASAPIQKAVARAKYWMSKDMMVHTASCWISIPIRNMKYIISRAIQSWVWILLASLERIPLQWYITHNFCYQYN